MCTGQAYSLTKPKAPFVTQASWWAEDLTQRGFSTMASATDIFESKVRAGPPCHSHSRRLASSPRCERMPSHLVCIRQSLTGESLFVCRRASANRFVSLLRLQSCALAFAVLLTGAALTRPESPSGLRPAAQLDRGHQRVERFCHRSAVLLPRARKVPRRQRHGCLVRDSEHERRV